MPVCSVALMPVVQDQVEIAVKRISEIELVKKNLSPFICGVLCVLLGVLLLFIPKLAAASNEEFLHTAVTVDRIRERGGVGGGRWVLYTDEGERFSLTGAYQVRDRKSVV